MSPCELTQSEKAYLFALASCEPASVANGSLVAELCSDTSGIASSLYVCTSQYDISILPGVDALMKIKQNFIHLPRFPKKEITMRAHQGS